MKGFTIASMLAILMALFSCEEISIFPDKPKAPTSLPPITSSGENTFGCYINGELFVPYHIPDFQGGCGGAGADFDYDNYNSDDKNVYLDINGHECNKNATIHISLNDYNITSGDYEMRYPFGVLLTPGKNRACYFDEFNGFYGNCTSNDFRGRCHIIKFDTVNRIVSGTFYFEAANETDTISVTDGRFDINYNDLRQ